MKRELWSAVLSSPDDLDARLVYADALTEEGDPRGEFISLQCKRALERLRGKALSAAKAREAELLLAHSEEWFGPLEKWLRERDSYAVGHVKVERGFVVACKLLLRDPDDLEVLFKKAPLLESLSLRGHEHGPFTPLQQLRHLELGRATSEPVLDFISSGARFDRLTHLALETRGLREARLAHLTSLETLTCDVNLKALTLPPSLTYLTVAQGSAALLQALQSSPLPGLRKLVLGKQRVTPPMAQALLMHAPKLERLVLDWATFEPGQLAVLLRAPWPRLKALDVSSAALGPDAATLLSGLRAPVLESLDLTNTRMKDDAVATLLRSPLLSSLRELSLRANKISAAALAPVLSGNHQLRLLNLKKTAVTPGELARLQKALPETRLSR
ncbi:MAG: TIGR02996 domain-containing protein [Archangium sp.]